jgi:putative ABC transport system permease protein
MSSASPEDISRQATEIYVRNAGRLKSEPFDFEKSIYKIRLQPLTQIHLHSSDINADKISNNTDIKYVYIFSSAAIILLIIACINFINIETSKAATRAKEVGVRKVLGAARGQLMKQFFVESTVITFLSMLLGLLLVYFFLPYFIEFTWKDLLMDFHNIYFITGLLVIFVVTSLLSGMYPALILSSFYPLKALQQKVVPTSQKATFRRALVMTQFVASILLIICALVVNGQLRYVKNKPLGYTKENLISIPIKGEAKQKTEVIKNELLAHGEVKNVTLCSEVLVNIKNNTELATPGVNFESDPKVSYIFADEDFFKTYQLEIIDGNIFSTIPSSERKSFVLNESAAKLLGEDSPVGKTITINGNMEGEVTGVVKNFHFKSLHQKIEPCVIVNNPPSWGTNQFVVRLSGHNVPGTLKHLQQVFKKANPAFGFEYHFIDQSLNMLYTSEARMGKFLDYFGILTLIVAGLGLFGLASFLTQQKAKEVAVRKVLGATSWHIILLNVREFMILLFFAALVGVPVGYYFMNDWLQNFSYRINLGIVFPLIALLLTLLTVLLAVAYHTILLSNTRPAEVLKNE